MKKRIIFTLQSVLLILCVTSSLMSCEAFQEENGWVNPELVTRVDTVVVDHYIRDSIFVHDTICVGDTIVITDTLIITVHDTIPGEDPIRTEKYVLQHNVVEGGAIVSDLQPTWLEIDGISVASDLVAYGVNGYNTQAGSVQVDSTKFAVVSKSPRRNPTSTGMRGGNTVTTASGDYVFELNSGSKYVVSTSAEAATAPYTVDGSSSYTANLLYTIDTDVNFEKANQTMFSDTIHDDGLVKQKMMEEATFVITRKQRPVSGAEVAMDERVTVTQEGWVVVDTLPVIPPPVPVDTVGILSATFSYACDYLTNELFECLLARTKDSVFVFINKKLHAVEKCNPTDYNSAVLLTNGTWSAGVIEIGGPGKGVYWHRNGTIYASMTDSSINTLIPSGSMGQGSSKSDMLQQCTVQNLGDGTTKIWLRGSVYMTISHR